MSWRDARPTRCQPCGARILVGPDEDVCAVSVKVDPAPISAAGELLALLGGRKTYRLRDGRLYIREWWHITDKTPRRLQVVAEHVCGCPGLPGPVPDPARVAEGHTEREDEPCPY